MTVSELIQELSRFPPNAVVYCTWEGVVRDLGVYAAKDGTVLIDGDGEHYRDGFESGEINIEDRR
jgi:hypothetical protein